MATFRELLARTKAQIQEVTPEEAETRLGRALFLDVREPDEVAAGALAGAIHLPRGHLEGHIEETIPDRDAEVVIYCAGGNRSAPAGHPDDDGGSRGSGGRPSARRCRRSVPRGMEDGAGGQATGAVPALPFCVAECVRPRRRGRPPHARRRSRHPATR